MRRVFVPEIRHLGMEKGYGAVRPVVTSPTQPSGRRVVVVAVLALMMVLCLTEVRVEDGASALGGGSELAAKQWQLSRLASRASHAIVEKTVTTTTTVTVHADGSRTTTTTTATTVPAALRRLQIQTALAGNASGVGGAANATGAEAANASGVGQSTSDGAGNATAEFVPGTTVLPSEVGCSDPLHCNIVDDLKWDNIPEPRGDQLPLGASRKTWPNIVNNKRTIMFCTSFYKYLGNRETCIKNFAGHGWLDWQISPASTL